MIFLRGEGSELPINFATEADSSSSSEVSSMIPEEELKRRAATRFCSNQEVYNANAVPSGFTLRGIFAPRSISTQALNLDPKPSNTLPFKPISINTSALMEMKEDQIQRTGNELALWQPTGAALAIKLYALSIDETHASQLSQNQQADQVLQGQVTQGLARVGQAEVIKHVYKRRSAPSKMRLPTKASILNPATRVVEKTARRSIRLQAKKDGFCYRLERNPTKRHNVTALQINSADGEAGPVPVATLQAWGIDCGVDPGDLTEEALMQVPGNV